MDPQEYDEIIRHLVRIVAHQDTINEDLRAMFSTHNDLLKRQATTNERLEITQARVETTLARIETLLARMIQQEDNGREA